MRGRRSDAILCNGHSAGATVPLQAHRAFDELQIIRATPIEAAIKAA
jgi:hypothetical protein